MMLIRGWDPKIDQPIANFNDRDGLKNDNENEDFDDGVGDSTFGSLCSSHFSEGVFVVPVIYIILKQAWRS